MGLLEWLFFHNWPRRREFDQPPDLSLDIARQTLGGFGHGTPVETLKVPLGPPVSWRRIRRRRGQWIYPGLGVVFHSERGQIAGFDVVARQPEVSWFRQWKNLWRPWTGSITFPDGFQTGSLEVRLDDFLAHLGDPTDREDDEVEGPTLVYPLSEEPEDSELEIEFNPFGELKSLDLAWWD